MAMQDVPDEPTIHRVYVEKLGFLRFPKGLDMWGISSRMMRAWRTGSHHPPSHMPIGAAAIRLHRLFDNQAEPDIYPSGRLSRASVGFPRLRDRKPAGESS